MSRGAIAGQLALSVTPTRRRPAPLVGIVFDGGLDVPDGYAWVQALTVCTRCNHTAGKLWWNVGWLDELAGDESLVDRVCERADEHARRCFPMTPFRVYVPRLRRYFDRAPA